MPPGGRRLLTDAAATMPDGFSYDPNEVYIAPYTGTCPVLDKQSCSYSNTNGKCLWEAQFSQCQTKICFNGCDNSDIGDNRCDAACNNFLCDYDGGDCKTGADGDLYSGITADLRTVNASWDIKYTGKASQGLCASGCYALLTDNGQCDEACNNEACGYDRGECCAKPTGNASVAVKGKFTLEYYRGKTYDIKPSATTNSSARRATVVYPRVKPLLSEGNAALTRGIPPNRLVAGVLITTERQKLVPCNQGETLQEEGTGLFEGVWRHTNLAASCRSTSEDDVDKESYGFDPVFAPFSELYNVDVVSNRDAYYNFSDPLEVDQKADRPYGFIYRKLAEDTEGFYSYMDVNFGQDQTKAGVQYLKDAQMIDEKTKSVKIDLLMYNPSFGHFTKVLVTFEFGLGGTINLDSKVENFDANLYETSGDVRRFALEVIFLIIVAFECVKAVWEFFLEVRDLTFFDGVSRFFNFWMLTYHTLLILYIVVYIQWFGVYAPMVQNFKPEMRYNVYTDLEAKANFMNNVDMAQYAAAVKMFEDADSITAAQNTYMELSGVAMILILFRMLRLLEFQPRLALVTKTVYHALEDMVHFFAILVVIMGLYLVQSYYLFGSYIDDYHTMAEAWTANFNMLLGDTGHFNAITDKFSIAGYLFCYSFNIIVFFILLNILLAIVVEAYMKVVEDNTATMAQSVPAQVSDMLASTAKKWSFVRNRSEDWMAQQYASDTTILDSMGDDPEDKEHPDRKVMITPYAEGEWLEPGVASIVKALTVHPDTKELDLQKKICIAASMIYRHGEPERGSAEASATMDFRENQLVHMAEEISIMLRKTKMARAVELWRKTGTRGAFMAWKQGHGPLPIGVDFNTGDAANFASSKALDDDDELSYPDYQTGEVEQSGGFFGVDLFGGCSTAAPTPDSDAVAYMAGPNEKSLS